MRLSPRFLVSLLMIGLAIQAFWVSRQVTFYARERISPPTIRVDLEADRRGMAKLYWDRGQGIREADSAAVAVFGDAGVRTLRFPVPRGRLKAVRLDPLRSEGRVGIHRIELRSGSGQLLSTVDLSVIRAGNQIASMALENGVLVAQFADGARDPTLFLGAVDAKEGRTAVGFPWLGLILMAAIVSGLFTLRRHTGPWVDRIRNFRVFPESWVRGVERIDRPDRVTLVVGALLVGLIQAFLLFPLHHAMDLPLWDEARTMAQGAAFLTGEGLGNPPDSPLARLLYAGLVDAFGRIGAIFAAHYVIKTALAVVVFLFAAGAASSVLVGLALSNVWVLSEFQLGHPILTYQAALFWFIVGLLTLRRFPVLAVGCVLLAALTRLEYQFAWVAVLAVVAVGWIRRGFARGGGGGWPGWFGVGLVWGLVGFVLLHLDGWDWGTSRGWFAVEQHYALRLQEEGRFPGHNPFLDYPVVTERDFPGAQSLGEAARINPGALAAHVWWNLQRVPGSCLGLLRPRGISGLGSGMAALIFLLVALPGTITLVRSPALADRRLWKTFCANGSVVATILSGLLVIAPGVIVFPKESYLLPILPLGLAVIGLLHREGDGPLTSRWNRRASLVAVLIGFGWVLIGPRPFTTGVEALPVRDTVDALEAVLPANGPVTLLGVSAGSYADLLGPDRVRGVEPLTTQGGGAINPYTVSMKNLLETHHPDLILIDGNWRLSPYFDAEGAAALGVQGWTETAVPGAILLKRP